MGLRGNTMVSASRRGILFPGQGAQYVGMGVCYVERYPECRELFEKAADISSLNLLKLCRDGPASELDRTAVSQPAIFVTSLACLKAYELEHGSRLNAKAVAGLSLGEYTALHYAGAIGFEDACRLVSLRGRVMEEAAKQVPSGMTSVMNANPAMLQEIVEDIAKDDVLCLANHNSPSQIVISGTLSALEKAEATLRQRGARVIRLKVAGAFHSPLMNPAKEKLREEIERVTFRKPSPPVVSNVTARYHESAKIRELLLQQLTTPVLWLGCMEFLLFKKIRSFVEPAPGKVLSRLLARIDNSVEVISLDNAQP